MASCGAGSAGSETRSMSGSLSRGNREILLSAIRADGSAGKGSGHNPGMHGGEKSDSVIVPEKEANNEKRQRPTTVMAEL